MRREEFRHIAPRSTAERQTDGDGVIVDKKNLLDVAPRLLCQAHPASLKKRPLEFVILVALSNAPRHRLPVACSGLSAMRVPLHLKRRIREEGEPMLFQKRKINFNKPWIRKYLPICIVVGNTERKSDACDFTARPRLNCEAFDVWPLPASR